MILCKTLISFRYHQTKNKRQRLFDIEIFSLEEAVIINPKLRDHDAQKERIKQLERENAKLRHQADMEHARKDLM